MKSLTRFLTAAAALAAVSLAASGCDASPYAASVNSHVIKQTALDAELGAWASNTAYVGAFDSANGSSGVTVVGDAPGTYSTTWVASILDNMITASAVHQRLGALHRSPDAQTVQAARAVSEISQIGWYQFPASFRNTLVMRLAEDATITPPSVDQQTLKNVYDQYKQYFFSQVCVLQTATFSLSQAQRLVAQGYVGGSQVCYDQPTLEAQSAAFRNAAMTTPVDKVAQPITTRYGYEVIQVVSRQVIGFTQQLQRTISVAVLNAQGAPNTDVDTLLTHAKVKVNPRYGTWSTGQVAPPKTPGS